MLMGVHIQVDGDDFFPTVRPAGKHWCSDEVRFVCGRKNIFARFWRRIAKRGHDGNGPPPGPDASRRGISVEVIENALVMPAARRLVRPADAPPLCTIRSAAHFVPVIEEVLDLKVPKCPTGTARTPGILAWLFDGPAYRHVALRRSESARSDRPGRGSCRAVIKFLALCFLNHVG